MKERENENEKKLKKKLHFLPIKTLFYRLIFPFLAKKKSEKKNERNKVKKKMNNFKTKCKMVFAKISSFPSHQLNSCYCSDTIA